MDLQIWGFGEPLSKGKLALLCLLGEASLTLTAFLTQIAHSGLSLQNNCLKIGWEGRTPFIRLSLGEPSQKGLLQGQSCTKIAPNLSEPSFYCGCPSVFTCLITVCFLDGPRWHHSETRSQNKLRLQELQLLPSHLSHRNTTPAEFCSLCLIIFVWRSPGAGANPMLPSTKPSPPESPRVRPTYLRDLRRGDGCFGNNHSFSRDPLPQKPQTKSVPIQEQQRWGGKGHKATSWTKKPSPDGDWA